MFRIFENKIENNGFRKSSIKEIKSAGNYYFFIHNVSNHLHKEKV